MRAIAKANRASGRNNALQLEVSMRIGGREAIAEGQLISHPSGLARLELRGFNGRIDRYLLSGRELLGAKDGEPLDRPQPMLPPIFFLQPSSEATLRAAFASFDVSTDSIGLATCGEQDCFVIGDPRLAVPLIDPRLEAAASDGPVLEDPLAEAASEANLQAGAGLTPSRAPNGLEPPGGQADGRPPEVLAGPELAIPEDMKLARVWVDTKDLQVRRIDRPNGVFTIFGPVVSFDDLMMPAWFEIHAPDAEPIRFEIHRAVSVNAPPKAFSQTWLLAPPDSRKSSAEGPAASGPADSPPPGF